MKSSQHNSVRFGLWRIKSVFILSTLILVVATSAGALGMRWYLMRDGAENHLMEEPPSRVLTESGEELASPEVPRMAVLPKEQWEASGIVMASAVRSDFTKTIQLTGKISLNQDSVAHIYPMVAGAVDHVSVSLGQSVKEDDLMIVIHSRDVGKAKLELYQDRLLLEMAKVKDRMQSETAKNTRELLIALRASEPITEIEQQFRNRPMGDYRERLLAAYSNFLKSQVDVNRLEGVSQSGAISGKQLLAAQANRNADLATFQSRLEQIEYELTTSLLLTSQGVKESETRVAVDETNLRILGCGKEDIDSVDPARQGESIPHYPIRAPFDGTVITKDVVLREQVGPDKLLLSIADLSTVWITADVYEEHVSILGSLKNKKIAVHNEAWPGRIFEAEVFYTGEIMDEATRTISMRAIADNREHLLKPGMFVTIEMQSADEANVLQLPLSAVQEHEGQKFVFVHVGDDHFERHEVKLGPTNGTTVVIRNGLPSDGMVVVKGGFILKSKMLADLMGEE